MKFRFIATEKAHHALSLLCRCLRVTRSGYAAPLMLTISPYRGGAELLGSHSRRGNAVIMIHDPDRPRVEGGELVRRQFALSPQEADLVCAIADGSSLDEFARRSNRTLEAVRSQLKRVFRKTGTSRQSELVKLVLSGPACMVQ